MALLDSRTVRVLITALLFAAVLGFLYAIRATLVAFLFAIFFAYLISPLVSHLERVTRGRASAIAAIYVILVGLVGVLFAFMGQQVGHEGARLWRTLPSLISQFSSGQIAEQIGEQHGWNYRTTEILRSILANHGREISQWAQQIGLRLADVAKDSWLLLVVPILSIFFLKDGRSFSDAMLTIAQSRAQRELLQGVLNDLNQMLAHFIRAQLILAALTFIAYSSVLSIMKVPYALVLGTVGGLLEFIPLIGPLTAAVAIVGVALLLTYPHWVALIVFLGCWRLLQDYFSSPRILGKSMELHPLATIFGIMAGGEVAGILGIYLSIPVMASLRIVFRRWRLYAEKRKFGPLNDYVVGAEIIPRK